MPLHGYSTDRRPPTNMDHLYAHPYAIVLGGGWQILAGALTLLMTLTDFSVSQSVARMPQSLIAALGVLLIAGGTQIVRGLLNDDDDLMRGWAIERTGLILSAAAWAAYTVTLYVGFRTSVLGWSLALAFVAVNLIRFRATRIEERRARERTRKALTG